jgi:bZIP transcription factor
MHHMGSAPHSFDAGPAFSGDFLSLPLQSEEHVWGLISPMSPSLPSWNPKNDQPFATATLERDLKNSHVRNGQPTPPPFDDRKQLSASTLVVVGGETQWNGLPSLTDRPQQPIFDQHAAKRRKLRERKSSAAGSSTTTSTTSTTRETDDQRQESAKREKFLERNRLAASKCRQKKKEHTLMLESQFKEQSSRKDMLNAEIARLRSEILGLKNEVLKHAQCGDEPIKLHLAQMVKKITYNDAAEFRETATAPNTAAADHRASPSLPAASMSFGFDEPLPLDHQTQIAGSIEQQIRRGSEASMSFSADEDFNDLLNV